MLEHFEINDEFSRKLYSEGYAAYVHRKTIKEMPSFETGSPEAEAWLRGYHDARTREEQEEIKKLEDMLKLEEIPKKEETQRQEEIALLERMYKKSE